MTDALTRQDAMTRDELILLAERSGQPCVSAYLPTAWVGADMQQNQIRFKNLMRHAAERLGGYGMRPQEIEEILAPAAALQKNTPYWKQLNDGLAVFISRNVFRSYRLPLAFAESLYVKERFLLQPLLPLFNRNNRYYVLSVSKKAVHFYQGLGDCLIEVEPKQLPRKLEDTTKYDVTERQHRNLPGTRGGGTGLFHGHGGWQDESKEQVARFLNDIERSVQAYLKDEQAPMVFAGVDYLFAAYREINAYGHLLTDAVIGNPDALRADELAQAAWRIVQDHYGQIRQEAIEQFRQSAGTPISATGMKDVVPACYHGRTGVLFTAANQRQWGHYDPDNNNVVLHDQEEQDSEDLCDLSAIYTFLNKGIVYELSQQEMPGKAKLAALLRY